MNSGPIHTITMSAVGQPEFITLAQAKDHLKVTWDDEDQLISGYLQAAISEAEGILDSFIRHRDVVMGVSDFAMITPLYYGPVIDGQFTAEYTDQQDQIQTVTDDFRLIHPWGESPWFRFIGSESFPQVKDAPDALRFSYSAGIKDAADMHPDIMQGILLILSDFYEYRTDRKDIISTRVRSLLRPYRKGA